MMKTIKLPETQATYLKMLNQAAEEAKKAVQIALGVVLAGHEITSVKSAKLENNTLIYDDGQPDA